MIEQHNALIHETSPYLLQHAHNPVNWQAWSPKSLAQAKQEDKPILLSIGYASCHWCHVMEKESFEDPMVAEVMNDNFVCIKVDREEMPDVDQLYMDAVQAMGLQGGWPLNVFLTPDQKPFYGGTYFPRQNWIQLLESVAVAFRQKREELEESADAFAHATGESIVQKLGLQEGQTGNWKTEEADLFFQKIQGIIDWEQGGTQGAPKFPMPVIWEFLLHYAHLTQNDKAQEAVTITLEEMARGGIYDQVGGGFARYSVDAEWFAPHFEKMLYDNGQLLTLYSRAYKVTPKAEYARIIRETVAFLEREMQHPSGGFFSGLDADSEGVEGKFYTWTGAEWDNAAGEDGSHWKPFYNIAEEGNWENGRNILYTQETPEQFAQRKGLDEAETLKSLAALKENLLEVRKKRIAPARDEKVLTGWNALIIEGLCEAYQALGETHFLEVAQKAMDFVLDALYREGKLHRSWKEGTLKQDAFLEDYALLIRALLTLNQSDFNPKWYEWAGKLLDTVEQHFWDEAEGYYYFTHQESHALIARKKELFDNVIPSSNGVMAHNLWTMGKLGGNMDHLQKAERMLQKIRPLLSKEPHYLMEWARLYLKMAYPAQEVAIMGQEALSASAPLHNGFFPQVVVAASTQETSTPPLLEGRKVSSNPHLFYVCKNFACQLPVESWQEALKQLHP